MILPAQLIRKRCLVSHLVVPFNERTVRRGRSFGLSHCGYDVRVAEDVHLAPGEFKLASTVERFNMPTDLVAFVKDKSSWARAGICVQNTVIEPGWRGWLTLELTNHSSEERFILAGDPIAQILFQQLLEPTENPYTGKYQNQQPGPQEARLERELEPT